MFDMRYHIVSLVAVFLALAIGIMLGSSIENRGVLKRQQERLVKSIEEDIASIKSRNSELQKQLETKAGFEEKVLPLLIEDKLIEFNVAVIYFSDAPAPKLRADTIKTVKDAGANVQEIALDRGALKRMTIPGQVIASGQDNKYASFIQFASELVTTSGPVLAKLDEQGTWQAPAGFLPVNSVVMFAGGNKESLEEVALAKALKQARIKTVFVDSSDNKHSKVEAFVKEEIDTVDNLDMAYGRASLAYLLSGAGSGHYGVSSSAQELMPALN